MQKGEKMKTEDVRAYLDYLKNDCGFWVSVHFRREIISALPQELWKTISPYNSHTNPYCMHVKGNGTRRKRCICTQNDIYDTPTEEDAFCNVCYAGVCEYIVPVKQKKMTVGYIAISGYRQEAPDEALGVNRALWENYLSPHDLPRERCRTLLMPLKYMLEGLFSTYTQNAESEELQILLFLQEYHTAITLSELCAHFHRSRSHISHLFKHRVGMSLRAYCNELRLEDARTLLCTTAMSVTEIAFETGFCDTSYFIRLFKAKYGETPHQFRRERAFLPDGA
jgi:AraC-like DNA-binding protein